jgi:hypothetical protein
VKWRLGASMAAAFEQFSVQVDNALRPSLLVQVVYVLPQPKPRTMGYRLVMLSIGGEMSLALSGLMSGASNISCGCSMSSMMRSTSIPSQYPT